MRLLVVVILLCLNYLSLGQVVPQISISSSKSTITIGDTIVFKANYSGGGSSPKLQWKKNGLNVGSNSEIYADYSLKDGDKVACVLTSNDSFRVMNSVSSNFISPKVNSKLILPVLNGEGVVGLPINLTSSPTEKVIWKKDGVIISNPISGNLGSGKMVAGDFSTIAILSSPGNIFVDKCGKLYVCEPSKNRILRYDSENSEPIIVAGGNGKGLATNQLYEPNDVFVDENSVLYIADGNRIVKWQSGSTFGTTVININSSTNSIFRDSLGDLYYNDYFNHKVFKCKEDGTNITQIAGTTSTGIGNSGGSANQLNYPTGIFVDKNFDLYIADSNNHRIQKWKKGASSGTTVAGGNGNAYALFPGTYISNPNQLSFPNDVFVDKDLNIFISAGNDARIQKWALDSTSGITVAGGNGQGNASNQFSNTASVFLNEFGDIIVSDAFNKRIQKWKQGSLTGETIAGSNFPTNNITLNKPSAIQIDKKNDDLYIADWGTIQITKWQNESKIGTLIASRDLDLWLSNPSGLFLTTDGALYISQRVANTVLKWLPGANKGIIVAGRSTSGNADSLLYQPYSSFVDKNGNIYVVDSENHRIQKWKPGAKVGVTVAGGNGQGNGNNQLSSPFSIYVDSLGKMFISDRSNQRIVVWKEGESSSIKNVKITYPYNIKVDNFGNFYTISSSAVVKFDSNLENPMVVVGGKDVGNSSNIFSDPQDLEIDKYGNIYVADYGNGRVQKFFLENSQSITPKLPGKYTATVTTLYGEFTSNEFKVTAPDTDKDGIEDALDKCPNTPVGETVDANGCSLSQKDSDKDGVNDKLDKCPDTTFGNKVDSNGCADNQKDTDKDGITDDLDKCPETPVGTKVDKNGCSEAQLACQAIKPVIILKNGIELSTSTSGISYIWYLDNEVIPGATGSSYFAIKSGKYSVKALSSTSCVSSMSEYQNIQITGTKENELDFTISPNPFTKSIVVEFPNKFGVESNLIIYDLKGAIVYSKENVQNNEELNLSHLATGSYFALVTSKYSPLRMILKILKEQ